MELERSQSLDSAHKTSTALLPLPSESRQEEIRMRVSFKDIIGNTLVKQALFEHCVLPMKHGSLHHLLQGIRHSVGNILLHGPPGTGKTLLAQAVAYECDAELFTLSPSDILSKYQGESERYLRDTFQRARACQRAILFFDEFDAIAMTRNRSSIDEGNSRRLLSELLIQLTLNRQLQSFTANDETKEELPKQNKVCVIAATNRIVDLDDAILRRFECKLCVDPPNLEERVLLIRKFLNGISLDITSDELDSIATRIDVKYFSYMRVLLLRHNTI